MGYFCKFICFEKTVVAKMDWSCFLHLQGGHYHRGIFSEDDQPDNRNCPQDAPLNEGVLHYLCHDLSQKNKHMVLLLQDVCVRLGARIWWIPPPKMCEIGCIEVPSRSCSQVYIKPHLCGIKPFVVSLILKLLALF
jgi:hypothetical protein